jgi:integrase/recombinase XerD
MAGTYAAQTIESSVKDTANTLSQSVSAGTGRRATQQNEGFLHGSNGQRKYVNRAERIRILNAFETLDIERCLFGLVLAWTGGRVSEILSLSPEAFDVETSTVSIVTLKRRKTVIREVPIPRDLMVRIDRHYSLRRAQANGDACRRIWPWCRVTAWRLVRGVCHTAQVYGLRACPKGLRHGFGVATLQSGVPIHLIQRWMGHARLNTTLLYATVFGVDELPFARRFWKYSSNRTVPSGADRVRLESPALPSTISDFAEPLL